MLLRRMSKISQSQVKHVLMTFYQRPKKNLLTFYQRPEKNLEILVFAPRKVRSSSKTTLSSTGVRMPVYPFCLGEDQNQIGNPTPRYLKTPPNRNLVVSSTLTIGTLLFRTFSNLGKPPYLPMIMLGVFRSGVSDKRLGAKLIRVLVFSLLS